MTTAADGAALQTVAHQGKIVFKGPDDGIWVMNADGRDPHELTQWTTPSYSVTAWSPDGRRIAFARASDVVSGEIWVMNADGSHLHRLTNGVDTDNNPTWSPDGRRIAFERGDFSSDLYVMNADGSHQRLLRGNGGEPAWSPDGRKIAFLRDGEIWVMNGDGSKPHRLTSNPKSFNGNAEPAWSPDGRRIAFHSDRRGGGSEEIYVMTADGKHQHRLTANRTDGGGDYYPTWSPDGRKIAFQSERPPSTDIWVINDDDGSNPRRLTKNAGNPSWQPQPRKG